MAWITKIFSIAMLLICSLAVVCLVYSNTHSTEISFAPLLSSPLKLPTYLWIGLTLIAGFLIGAVWIWLGGIKYRRGLRQGTKKIRDLEANLDEVKLELATALKSKASSAAGTALTTNG